MSITDVLGRGWGSSTDWSRINPRNNRKDRPDQANGCKLLRIDKRATLIGSESKSSTKLGIGLCSRSHHGKGLYDSLQFVEEPVEIMEREIKRLKRSRIPLVKVRWNSRRGPEFTWEREDSFK
ncbi:hypothetical protein Tco_0320126 [Tanacetum coccineum]